MIETLIPSNPSLADRTLRFDRAYVVQTMDVALDVKGYDGRYAPAELENDSSSFTY